jgi:chromosome partitioning protein
MIRVLVTNIKGGCGKTTLATNLAAAFALGGFKTALAEVDRQKSVLEWLKLRGGQGSPILGLDWRKAAGELPDGIQRLVIDAPAAMTMKHVDQLLREADLVVVPVLPSVFDEGSTRRFMAKLLDLKPIRKGRKDIAIVANRLKPRSRAAQRLDTFLAGLDHPVVARLGDRAVYGELATQGLGIFDSSSPQAQQARAEWLPLLRTIEEVGR